MRSDLNTPPTASSSEGRERVALSRRSLLLGTSAVAVAIALPAVPIATEAPAAVRGPMTLPLLKELSERALPILEKHFSHGLRAGAFLAEDGLNYHGWQIACACPAEQLGGCECQWHPLAGTPMVGGMSGYYEPEWDEETAYEALHHIVTWQEKPDTMSDAEWVEALAIVGMTPESHAARLAQWELDCAVFDGCAAPSLLPTGQGEKA